MFWYNLPCDKILYFCHTVLKCKCILLSLGPNNNNYCIVPIYIYIYIYIWIVNVGMTAVICIRYSHGLAFPIVQNKWYVVVPLTFHLRELSCLFHRVIIVCLVSTTLITRDGLTEIFLLLWRVRDDWPNCKQWWTLLPWLMHQGHVPSTLGNFLLTLFIWV